MEIEHFISIKVCSHLPHCLQEDTSTIRFLDIFLKFSLSWLSQQRVADCAKGHYHQSLIVFRRMHVCVRYHIREKGQNSNLVIYDVNVSLEEVIGQLLKVSP